jgi:hypothetical protein
VRLIKFCRPEHRVPRCNRIIIGTLYDYRDAEEGPITPDGAYDFDLKVNGPIDVPGEVLDMLTSGAVLADRPDRPRLPPGVSVKVDRLDSTPNPDGSRRVTHLSGRLRRMVSNTYMFCMSTGEAHMPSPFPDYKSSWQVPLDMVKPFPEAMTGELRQDLRASLRAAATEAGEKAPDPVVRYVYGPVVYGPRVMTFDAQNPLTQASLTRALIRIPFIKPPVASNQQEFRFVFEWTAGGTVYVPGRDGLLIRSAAIAPFVVQ